MTLKELKVAFDAANSKLNESPDDAGLKSAQVSALAAYNAALETLSQDNDSTDTGTPGETGDDEGTDTLDESGLDEKTKAYIRKLRAENGKQRTKGKASHAELVKLRQSINTALGIDETEDSEVTAKMLRAENENLQFSRILLEQAVEYGVGKDEREFFEFFIGKKVSTLEEGEEIGDEDFAEAAKKAKRAVRNLGSAGSGNSTSVNDSAINANSEKKTGAVTLDKFKAMTIAEKSDLFVKNRTLYDELFSQANPKQRRA